MIAFYLTLGLSTIVWIVFFEMYRGETYCKETARKDKIYKISYKAFLSMYFICPSKWDINPRALANCILYKSYEEYIEQYFYFSFIDYYRFKSFLKKRLKEEQNYIKAGRMTKVLKSFREDIRVYDEENAKSLKKELKNIVKEREKF